MSKPLRTEEEAVQEIEDATRWYERQRPGLGTELLAVTDIILEQVSRFPKAGAFVSHVSRDLGVRRAPLDKFPYHLVYLEMEEEIRVLAFAHDRRRPGYWLSRSGLD